MIRPLRVIHCGTGTAGALALGAILDHPGMQLVGLLVHGEGRRGWDLGPGYPKQGELADDTLWRVTLEGEPSRLRRDR